MEREPLDILYRDSCVVAINKPAGMLVHPGREPEPTDQIAMKVLRDQIGQRVSPLHRLDRPTSGVLMFALEEATEREFSRQFAENDIEKRYVAVVPGKTPWKWTAEAALQKSEAEPFREAETRFTRVAVVERGDRCYSRLDVRPKTGRYHQIRKHLAMDGWPIVGDYLYGDPGEMARIARAIGQERLMLHASRLTFYHPLERSEVMVECPLPSRFAPFLEKGEMAAPVG